jgi:hypothetical protein
MGKLEKRNRVEVAIVNNKAYWVYNSILYEAEVHRSGEILSDEAKPVDVINMSKSELEKIIEVVDSFNE